MEPQFNQPFQPPQQQLPPIGGKKHNTALIVAFMSSALAVIFLGLFIWQFSERSSLQANYDSDLDAAALAAVNARETELREEFEDRLNSDTTTYVGSDVLGSITFDYPKTWSASINENDSGNTRLDATFHPNAISNSVKAFALKIQVVDDPYSQELGTYDNDVERGELTANPVTYSGVDGVRLNGQIDNDLTGSIVLLPLRDRTLILRTESDTHQDTFESILDSLQFSP
ncbi:TPA: hypothetical protein EYO12_00395 [Candidatus Saccharibacteria bacterium]|nr:hypothetical protein [Candidatus Saccharibacteria bacterium]HIO87554.1 hypothetical protein [Candidatus Saccharibacteria bacterium]